MKGEENDGGEDGQGKTGLHPRAEKERDYPASERGEESAD